jgi:NAD(P)-dependent dehydrogenase (short-subunit alcohol dehydrogenase family)
MSTRSVLITGAAAGIGRASAVRFAREGYRVGAYDVDRAGLDRLADELAGHEVVTGLLDVRDPEAWTTALGEFTAADDGRLTVLVNNAGVLAGGRFADIDLADHERTVAINVQGVVNGCHAAYPHLRGTPGAHVVNLASASAIYGQPELATYSATKFAVRGLSEALDLEWREDGITVTALWPLFVATGMTHDLDIASTRSLGVRLTADDVAAAVVAAATHGHGLLGGVHRSVGLQAKALFAAAEIAPGWATRLVNRALTR